MNDVVITQVPGGGTIISRPPAPPAYVPPPPREISMRQARRALRAAGLYGAVSAAIATLPSPQREDAEIDWEFAATVERDNGLLVALAPLIGLTDEQVDALFDAAEQIE